MLAAASLLPEGSLHALALEADPLAVAVSRDTMRINGLDSNLDNTSKVHIKEVFVANPGRKTEMVERGHFGLRLANRSKRSLYRREVIQNVDTADAILNGYFHNINLLYIAPVVDERSVLEGSKSLLRNGRIHCVLLHYEDHEKPWLTQYFQKFEYCSCVQGTKAW